MQAGHHGEFFFSACDENIHQNNNFKKNIPIVVILGALSHTKTHLHFNTVTLRSG